MNTRFHLGEEILPVAILALLLLPAVVIGQQQRVPNSAASRSVRKPDLVPILHHPMDARIEVKNIGHAEAGPSKLTLDCVRMESASKMYSCPNLPISLIEAYFDSAFPNNATIQVPAIAPKGTFTHTLAFWDVSKWPSGTYKFTARADAAHVLDESNLTNNVATSTLVVP